MGGGFPASFYGRPYYTPTIGIAADAFLNVPVIGDVKLGNGYFLYNYPDYLAFGGATSQSYGGVISMEGSLDGAFKASTGQFRLGGHVRGCIIGVICRGATGVISSHGVGACLEVGPVNIGGGVVYRPFEIKVWLLDGCKWSRFDEISLRASDASAGRIVRIPPGRPSRMIQLRGSTGAPQVRVTGPGWPGTAGHRRPRVLSARRDPNPPLRRTEADRRRTAGPAPGRLPDRAAAGIVIDQIVR